MKKPARRLSGIAAVAFGLAVGFILVFSLSAPRVEKFFPELQQPVSSLARINLAFSQSMNKATVEERFTLDPNQAGRLYWDEQTLIFEPDAPWPTDSKVTVSLAAGALGSNRLPILGRRSWTFEVGQASLIYLWPGEGQSDLYQWRFDADSAQVPLTVSEYGIQDFHMTADGTLLVYTANKSGGGTELRSLDLIRNADQLLLTCEPDVPCGAPSLSPNGEWLAFERIELDIGEAGRLLPSLSRVWLLPMGSDEAPQPLSPAEHEARNPRWSPTGWLVYYDAHLRALALLDPATALEGEPFNYLPTSLGIIGSWSPDGMRLLYPDIVFADEDLPGGGVPSGEGNPLYYSHLYLVEVTSGRTRDISPGGDWAVEDASPAFSPDGRWVAFTRKFLDPARWSPGRQVWLMDRDGIEIRPLTDEPNVTFSSLTWSPDSKSLAFMRKDVSDLSRPSEIWWLDVASGDAQRVVEGGFLPAWIP